MVILSPTLLILFVWYVTCTWWRGLQLLVRQLGGSLLPLEEQLGKTQGWMVSPWGHGCGGHKGFPWEGGQGRSAGEEGALGEGGGRESRERQEGRGEKTTRWGKAVWRGGCPSLQDPALGNICNWCEWDLPGTWRSSHSHTWAAAVRARDPSKDLRAYRGQPLSTLRIWRNWSFKPSVVTSGDIRRPQLISGLCKFRWWREKT